MDDRPEGEAGPRRGVRGRGSALLGPVLALPLLAVVVLAATAERPSWAGTGRWSEPVHLVLAGLALMLLAALVLLLRSLPSSTGPSPDDRPAGSWQPVVWAALIALLVVLPEAEPADDRVAPLGSWLFGGGEAADGGLLRELPVTPTAVVAGLVAVALLAAATALALRGPRAGRRRGPPVTGIAEPTPPATVPTALPDSPPDEVVLAAWSRARDLVVVAAGAGGHDPPGRLVRRVRGTRVAAPLLALTELYLPVRYGRRRATAADADAARGFLRGVERHLRDVPAGHDETVDRTEPAGHG